MAELQGAISAILLEADGAKGKGGSEGGKMRPPPPPRLQQLFISEVHLIF